MSLALQCSHTVTSGDRSSGLSHRQQRSSSCLASFETFIDQAADCFGARGNVRLLTAPVVDRLKPIRRDPHLKRSRFFTLHVIRVITCLTSVNSACSDMADSRGVRTSQAALTYNRSRRTIMADHSVPFPPIPANDVDGDFPPASPAARAVPFEVSNARQEYRAAA